ncbi:FAD-dependent oxidoreductase [Streptomyces sp. NPDC007100]|uniref:FAD-dependent oxidoreductase n=1 Tax=Streptomyces sp. NPDC007100 TaxID=3155602 RepID=UPI0033FC5B40
MFRVTVDGAERWAGPGQTAASLLLAQGCASWRTTRGGRPRGVFCGIGVCHDCLVAVNGVPDVRACRRVLAAGDRVETQAGARLPDGPRGPSAGARRDVAAPVAVIGAGPAGMAAALAAAGAGTRVVLVDDGERPGGQFHRRAADGPDRVAAVRAVQDHPRIEWLPECAVWALERADAGDAADNGAAPDGGWTVHALQGPADAAGRTAYTLRAAALVLCTGAYDRALPFPGWELPGVVTAGAAQALAKGQRTAVGRRVVVSGTGPFLLPVTASLLTVGADVLGVYEAGSPAGWLRAPVTALRDGRGKLPELLAYGAGLARHRVPYRTRSAVVAAHGNDRVEAVTVARLAADWRVLPGTERRIEGVDALCVGYGFLPQLELALAAGCALRDRTWVAVGAWQQTSVPGVYAAGEPTGVGGAALAAAEGGLAGLAAARWTGAGGVADPAPAIRRVRAGRRFARLLATAHPVRPGWRTWPDEDTLVCRCEEVPYRALCADAGPEADGMRAFKLATRVGLGPCQGRVCARNAAELRGAGPLPDPQTADRRPIAQPVRLADLAAGAAPGPDTEPHAEPPVPPPATPPYREEPT